MDRPESFWFGGGSARCFGMLHHPEAPSTRGVVFCNALGLEGLLAHGAYRRMADDLAHLGFWALRFDYDGEGDAAGGAWGPHRVDAWIESIDAAVAVLRARGVTEIRLVGFRIGATLACRYAATHRGVAGLVLWSPCAKGAAYVRELRALSRLSAVARPVQRIVGDWFPSDSMEVVGFELTGETVHALSDIDLVSAASEFVVPEVLLIDRDDAPPNDELAARLTEMGAHVEHDRMPGYEDFVVDGPESVVVPWPILHRIGSWLDAPDRRAIAPDVAPSVVPRLAASAVVIEQATCAIDDPAAGRFLAPGPARDRVVEEAVWIDDRFFAIVSRPAGDAPIRRASIVLCNAGGNNRIGPGRLYVGLARYWASLGFTVVRVDLGGCGDSLGVGTPTDDPHLDSERVEDLCEVVAWVRRVTGFNQLVAGGMCTGAFHVFQGAVQGLDLDHLLLINTGFYPESETESQEWALVSANVLTLGLANGRKWRLALTDREVRRRGVQSVRKVLRNGAVSGLRLMAVESMRNGARRMGLPLKASSVLARDLEAIIARGARVLLVFSADEAGALYLRTIGGPACAALAAGDGLDVVDIEGGDHIFSPPGARQRLVEVLTEYLEHAYT